MITLLKTHYIPKRKAPAAYVLAKTKRACTFSDPPKAQGEGLTWGVPPPILVPASGGGILPSSCTDQLSAHPQHRHCLPLTL